MYQQYWGLTHPPFNLGKNGQGYFKSPSQVEALARHQVLVAHTLIGALDPDQPIFYPQ